MMVTLLAQFPQKYLEAAERFAQLPGGFAGLTLDFKNQASNEQP
jgi:hypothetical protein